MSAKCDAFENIVLKYSQKNKKECPVCLEYKEDLIIICPNKHEICNDCWKILLFLDNKLCPICRDALRGLIEPVMVEKHGKKFYYINDMLHRKDQPAVYGYGTEEYYFLGVRHRLKEPAVISPTKKEWWYFGKRHNINGPANIEYNNMGIIIKREWWVNGVRHRLGGPSIISTNVREWWEYGKLIRIKKNKCIIS